MVAEVIKNQIDRIEHRESKIFWSLFSVFVFSLLSYGFLVNQTIINAVHQNKLEKEMTALNSEVNTMDFQYLEIKNNITHNLALAKGFVNLPNTNFAYIRDEKTSTSLSLVKN